MQYAIELYFDNKMEEELSRLICRVKEERLSTGFLEWKSRPHVTLACFHDVEEDACRERLDAFAKAHQKIPAYLGSVGMFTDTKVIFASPIMQEGMYRLQREMHQAMQGFDTNGLEWYLPDRWVPHCTLAMTENDQESVFFRACDLILHEFRKMSGQFASIGLVKITKPVEELFTVELQ